MTPVERARAWALANPERRKEIARRSYFKLRGPLKLVETEGERFERLTMPVPESGCLLWLGAVDKDGYGKAKVGGKDVRAHRWSWLLHKGEITGGLHVLHRCDVPTCVNPEHLFLGTNVDNVKDKIAKGRDYKLPPQRKPKLTEEQVAEIRRLRGKVRQIDLAAMFGVHHSQISRIQTGAFWRHLPLDCAER